MPNDHCIYRYRDIVDIHYMNNEIMNNRCFENIGAVLATPVKENSNVVEIVATLEDNHEFKLFCERIIGTTIASYVINVFIREISYILITFTLGKPKLMVEEVPYGFIKLSQAPMSSVIDKKYGHMTQSVTIDGRYHFFDIRGTKGFIADRLNACTDMSSQYYSALFPLSDIETYRSKKDSALATESRQRLYEPEMVEDNLDNGIHDPFPSEIIESLLEIDRECTEAVVKNLATICVPGISHINIAHINVRVMHAYQNRAAVIYDAQISGYCGMEIEQLSPWRLICDTRLLSETYYNVIWNMITAIYSTGYDIIVPLSDKTEEFTKLENGKLVDMIESEIQSVKYHLGRKIEDLPVDHDAQIPAHSGYDKCFSIFGMCLLAFENADMELYEVIEVNERKTNDGIPTDDIDESTIIIENNGSTYEIRMLVILNASAFDKLEILNDLVPENEVTNVIIKAAHAFIYNELTKIEATKYIAPDNSVLKFVGSTADYPFISELYLKIEKPVDTDISLDTDNDVKMSEKSVLDELPELPKPEIIKEDFGRFWPFRKKDKK